MRRLLLLYIAVITVHVSAFAATIYVPGDYATIQQAIDFSSYGDSVLVAPGI